MALNDRNRLGDLVQLAVRAAIGLVVVVEVLDEIAAYRRRVRRTAAKWWTDVGRRESRDLRRVGIGLLARWLRPR